MINKIKEFIQKLYELNATPNEIAYGFAIGAFLGVFPTFGVGTLLAIGICAIFRLNYIAAVAGSFIIMNPLTTPFFWLLSAGVGGLIFAKDSKLIVSEVKSGKVFASIGEITIIYIVGSLIVSVIVGVISYFIVKGVIERRQKIMFRSL